MVAAIGAARNTFAACGHDQTRYLFRRQNLMDVGIGEPVAGSLPVLAVVVADKNSPRLRCPRIDGRCFLFLGQTRVRGAKSGLGGKVPPNAP